MSTNNQGLEISVNHPKVGTAKTFKFDRHALYGFPQQRELREDISEQAASITKPNAKSPHAEAVAEAAKRAFAAQVDADAAAANQKKNPDKVRSELLAIRKKLERDQNIMQVMSRTPVPQTKLETGFEIIEDVVAGIRYGVGVAHKETRDLKKRELRDQEQEKQDELRKAGKDTEAHHGGVRNTRDINQKLQRSVSAKASAESPGKPADAEPAKGPLASIEQVALDAANGAKAVGADAGKGAVEVATEAKDGLNKVATAAAEGMGEAASNAPSKASAQTATSAPGKTEPNTRKTAEPALQKSPNPPATKATPPRDPSEGRPQVIRKGKSAGAKATERRPAVPAPEPLKRAQLSPGMEDLLKRARSQARAADSPSLQLLKPKDVGARPTALSMKAIQARKQAQAALPTKVTVVTNLLKIIKDRGR